MLEDLRWRKLEKRREEMKVLFDKRLEGVEESRLVKIVVEDQIEDRGIGGGKIYMVLRRMFELDNEVRLDGRLRQEMRTGKKYNIQKAHRVV